MSTRESKDSAEKKGNKTKKRSKRKRTRELTGRISGENTDSGHRGSRATTSTRRMSSGSRIARGRVSSVTSMRAVKGRVGV